MQHCFIKRYKTVSLFPIEFCSHNVWFYQLRHRLHECLKALKRKYIWCDLHIIVKEKVKILHFHKSWWSSILYHSVANASRYLYISVLILPELVIDLILPQIVLVLWLFRAVNLRSFDFWLIDFFWNEAKKVLIITSDNENVIN